MKEVLRSSMLYDFYAPLITEKQRHIFDMYYNNDLSLSEIGEQLGITKQAVSDILKRTYNILSDYESKMGLINKFENQKHMAEKIKIILNTEIFDKKAEIYEILDKMLSDF